MKSDYECITFLAGHVYARKSININGFPGNVARTPVVRGSAHTDYNVPCYNVRLLVSDGIVQIASSTTARRGPKAAVFLVFEQCRFNHLLFFKYYIRVFHPPTNTNYDRSSDPLCLGVLVSYNGRSVNVFCDTFVS